ncbi:MAG TPA: hypothetical protein VGR96_05140 [Acidobacteriaceae bacterium]|nr:hypothetical protein [Acidobacteriaceae bacterium]
MKFCRGFLLVGLGLIASAAIHGQSLSARAVLAAGDPVQGGAPLVHDAVNQSVQKQHANEQESQAAVPGGGAIPEAPLPGASTAEYASAAHEPITVEERLLLFWDDTYNSPGAFVALSVSAMIDQLSNQPETWTRDGNGYTRRFGSGYGQLALRNVIHDGMAGMTGLDPRYRPCNCRGAFKRSGYAIRMSLTTYSRQGRLTLDVPQIAGAYGSGMLSTYWYPHRQYNPLVQGVQFGHEEMGEAIVGNLFHEFGADMKHAFHLHSGSEAVQK